MICIQWVRPFFRHWLSKTYLFITFFNFLINIKFKVLFWIWKIAQMLVMRIFINVIVTESGNGMRAVVWFSRKSNFIYLFIGIRIRWRLFYFLFYRSSDFFFFFKMEKYIYFTDFLFFFVLRCYDTCFFNFKTRSPRTTSVCFLYINH